MKLSSRALLIIPFMLLPLASGAQESSSSSAVSSASSSRSAGLPPYAITPETEKVIIPTDLASSCLSNPNKDLCIPDMLKQLQRAKVAFVNQQRRKRDAWKSEHASMGRTQEYLDMLQAFSNEMKKESDLFEKQLREATKKLHDAQKGRSRTGSASSSSRSSSSAPKVDQSELDKCAKITDEVKRRVCIRAITNRSKLRLTTEKMYK